MLMIDFNQLAISNLMAQIGNHTNVKIEEDLVRYMILNKIRILRQKFKEEDYGEIVIACDGKSNWRRQYFPQYKAMRRAAREASDFDWGTTFDVLNKIRDELRENFNYVVIHIEGAEADDIIGSLVVKHGVELNSVIMERLLIVSGDKDFVQLQRFVNVEQYDPIKNVMIRELNPQNFVLRHILKGDRGDGVPNVLSDDNCLVEGVRQKKVTEKFIGDFSLNSQSELIKRNFTRNEMLIDLSKIPMNLMEKIYEVYDKEKCHMPLRKQKIFNYFVAKRLKNLIEYVGEF
jgi:5'-3' exonuclease